MPTIATTMQNIPSKPECESAAAAEAGVEEDVSTEYPIMGARDCVSLLKKAAEPVIDADTGCRRLCRYLRVKCMHAG